MVPERLKFFLPIKGYWCDFSRKEISLAKTAEEAQAAWSRCPEWAGLPAEAMEKWERLSLTAVRQAQTIEELGEAWRDAPENSKARQMADKKIDSLVLVNPEW